MVVTLPPHNLYEVDAVGDESLKRLVLSFLWHFQAGSKGASFALMSLASGFAKGLPNASRVHF